MKRFRMNAGANECFRQDTMTDPLKGIAALVVACTVWGLSPLFYKMLAHVPAIEVLAHRTIWSAVIFSTILLVQRRFFVLWETLSQWRMFVTVATAALLVSTNWFLYIWSVGAGYVTESSLGYFLFPLVAVVLGRIVLGETLGKSQKVGVALAACGVATLTFGLGAAPWIALGLATTFGLYGLIKKTLDLGPVISVTGEVVVLLPIAGIVLWLAPSGSTQFGYDALETFLLIVSGFFTAIPLILFSYATRRIKLSTVGLIQYLNPSLQFFCAVLIFSEPFGMWHAIAFSMIWIALAFYSIGSLLSDRAEAMASTQASGSSTT